MLGWAEVVLNWWNDLNVHSFLNVFHLRVISGGKRTTSSTSQPSVSWEILPVGRKICTRIQTKKNKNRKASLRFQSPFR